MMWQDKPMGTVRTINAHNSNYKTNFKKL